MIAASSRRRSLPAVVLVALLIAITFYYHSYTDAVGSPAICFDRLWGFSLVLLLRADIKCHQEGLIAMIPYGSKLSNSTLSTSLISSPLNSSQAEADSNSEPKTSRLHYLIPASLPNLNFCYNLVSSAVNRYPVPSLLGWHGADEFDAAKTHLAKLRSMERYFNSLPPEEDDDLVIIVDGYDILIQLPPEIMVERYFQLAERADAHLAQRFDISVGELHRRGLRQTIFLGPDKICWPIDPHAPRCWAAPESPIPPTAWGSDMGDNAMFYSDPRWLNSGTIMAPIGDIRKYIAATMDEIRATHDPAYEFRESDQYYLANVWARQEYWRSRMMDEIPEGPPDRIIPVKSTPFQTTEYHVAIEYESALFQTRAGYEPYFGYVQFNETDLTTKLTADVRKEGSAFEPPTVKMPKNVAASLGRLYDDIPETHPGSTSEDWLSIVELGVNFVTRHIYGLWHCTGPKQFVELEYPTLWFYPFVKSLLKAAVRGSQAGEPLTEKLIDGRRWVPKNYYPAADVLDDEFGGAWTDLDGEFVPWRDLCEPHNTLLFLGEETGATLGFGGSLA
ncbi:hypothetical protein TARUN_3357 [Trichoderma arundinaceum]|uniref:Uncharacterized protein n=1 Tax=Trichoderma arundinaceum TaxID=490622 RepID=A0A395NS22_TRIAR|nr:hypothetical protein TARUN_3357 [Trichoderma arundinaceum]